MIIIMIIFKDPGPSRASVYFGNLMDGKFVQEFSL